MCLIIFSHIPALVVHPQPYPVILPASSSSLLMVTLPIPQSPWCPYICGYTEMDSALRENI